MKRRPTAWRHVIVALWDALAHVLIANKPGGYEVKLGPGEMVRLFRAVATERPELPQVEKSIELIDDLRSRWLPAGVTRWPVELDRLPGIVEDGIRAINRLAPDIATSDEASTEAI